MPELKGSKTEQNLMAAFAGESQATNKYSAMRRGSLTSSPAHDRIFF